MMALRWAKTMQSEFDQRYLAAPDVLFQRVGDEGVLLDLASERYFSLNEVGARFWELLAEDASLARALAVLVQEYEVSDQVLRADLDDLLAALTAAALVRELPGDGTGDGQA